MRAAATFVSALTSLGLFSSGAFAADLIPDMFTGKKAKQTQADRIREHDALRRDADTKLTAGRENRIDEIRRMNAAYALHDRQYRPAIVNIAPIVNTKKAGRGFRPSKQKTRSRHVQNKPLE